MPELLGPTVDDLVASLKARRQRIPSEIGAFVALETCEAILRAPVAVRGGEVRISEDGVVGIFAAPNAATPEGAARSVVGILASLLVASGTGVPPRLVSLVEGGGGSGPDALAKLRDELEASLVPLNRAASRRVLSRMIREARRTGGADPMAAADVPEERLDAALDDLLGDGPATASDPDLRQPAQPDPGVVLSEPFAHPDRDAHPISVPPAALAPLPSHEESTSRAPRELMDEGRRAAQARTSEPSRAGRSDPARAEPARGGRSDPARADEPARATRSEPARSEKPRRSSDPGSGSRRPRPASFGGLDEFEAPRAQRGGGMLRWALGFFVVAVSIVVGVAIVRPDFVDRALGRPVRDETPQGPTDAEREAAIREHRLRFGSLSVRSTPDRAQALLYVGRGPAIARDLPMGMAYELVAIADGRQPTRAVVPADAQWESTPEGMRYELAMQTGPALREGADPEALALGDTQLPRDALGAPSPSLGSIRVVTNPPGAKVYLLVGFTPDVHVENVRTDEAIEILVYHEGHALERRAVLPSDWVIAEDGRRSVDLELTLRPLGRGR
jgi:hypothetical protein